MRCGRCCSVRLTRTLPLPSPRPCHSLGRNRLGLRWDAVPAELSELSSLRRLELQKNGFTVGPPAVVGELTSLQVRLPPTPRLVLLSGQGGARLVARNACGAHPAGPAALPLQELYLSGNEWGSAAYDLPQEYSQLRYGQRGLWGIERLRAGARVAAAQVQPPRRRPASPPPCAPPPQPAALPHADKLRPGGAAACGDWPELPQAPEAQHQQAPGKAGAAGVLGRGAPAAEWQRGPQCGRRGAASTALHLCAPAADALPAAPHTLLWRTAICVRSALQTLPGGPYLQSLECLVRCLPLLLLQCAGLPAAGRTRRWFASAPASASA